MTPRELIYSRSARTLTVVPDDGAPFALPATLMRVESPSAEVQGHGPGQKKTVTGKETVGIERMELVGNYAVRLIFDDGHDSGIYSWAYLRELARQQPEPQARECADA